MNNDSEIERLKKELAEANRRAARYEELYRVTSRAFAELEQLAKELEAELERLRNG